MPPELTLTSYQQVGQTLCVSQRYGYSKRNYLWCTHSENTSFFLSFCFPSKDMTELFLGQPKSDEVDFGVISALSTLL